MTCDKEFLDMIPKVHSKKQIMIHQSSTKFKIFVLQKLWREQKDKLQNQRNYLQIAYLIMDLYPDYLRNSPNAIIRKETIQFK